MNIMDHDDDDLVGVNDDDDDDVSLDSFDNEPFEDMMRRLGTNDPSLTTLRVGVGGVNSGIFQLRCPYYQ